MIDERTVELIHADIDDVLPESDRAELARHLLGDQEARSLHRDMQGLHETLAALGQADVPEALQQSLMAAIPAAASGAAARTGRRARGAGWQAWRLGALAAAAAVGALVLKLAPSIDRVDGQGAVGTLAAPPTVVSPGSALRLDRPEIAGSVRLWQSGSSLVVELDVALHDALDVTAEHDGHTATVTGLQPAGSGPQHVRLELPAGAEPGGTVSVRFSSKGRVIEEVALGLSGAQ